MIHRCYDTTNINYESYGAKGVFVSTEWLNYSSFFIDAQKLIGWNEHNIDHLTIDKDGLSPGNKCYSKEFCQWVTLEVNNNFKELLKRDIVGIDPNGVSHVFTNIREFAKSNKLTAPNIHMCLKKNNLTHKGWMFYAKGVKEVEN